MKLTFRTNFDIGASMSFESCNDPLLRVRSEDRKRELILNGVAVWMFVNNVVVGEAYGAPATMAQDPDVSQYADNLACACLFGAAIMPEYQGRRLSKYLIAYWNALAHAHGYNSVVGHAAHPAMVATARFFGSEFLFDRPNWGGTSITARFFRMTP